MKLSRPAIAVYLGIVFLSGGVLGFFANRLYSGYTVQARPAPQGPQDPREFLKGLVRFYNTRLQLTGDQTQKLELILDDANAKYQAEFKKERAAIRPELRRIHQEQVERITEILTPTQREEYQRVLKEQERSRGKKGGRPGGPGI
jgi:Spy/CpxP family protein refolding chaperone